MKVDSVSFKRLVVIKKVHSLSFKGLSVIKKVNFLSFKWLVVMQKVNAVLRTQSLSIKRSRFFLIEWTSYDTLDQAGFIRLFVAIHPFIWRESGEWLLLPP